MRSKPCILVIDDEQQILRALKTILGQQSYQVNVAASGEEGLTLAAVMQPDLVILDVGLPDTTGVEICKKLREWTDIPILILSAHDTEAEKVASLDAGADDYLTKPFGVDELLARTRVALRHRSKMLGSKSSVVYAGNIAIDLSSHQVTRNGAPVRLTATEYQLLAYLATNAGRVLTHRAILNHVWGFTETNHMEYLRVYIRQLRRKLEDDPRNPQMIVMESGVGYRFMAN